MAAPGFLVKIHNSLISPIMIAGVPRQFFMLNGTLGAAIVLGMQFFYAIPVFVIIHFIAVMMAKRDPYFFQVLLRHMRQKNYYDV